MHDRAGECATSSVSGVRSSIVLLALHSRGTGMPRLETERSGMEEKNKSCIMYRCSIPHAIRVTDREHVESSTYPSLGGARTLEEKYKRSIALCTGREEALG